MTPAAELTTERLRMHRHSLEDFDECAALWADPAVTRFVGGRPLSSEESWSRLLRYAGHWALLGFGFWVVREKATGAFIGEVGFAELKREMTVTGDAPSIEGLPEMGWVLATRAHGQGYATEAIRSALEWGGASLPQARTVCLIDPENAASLRVAAKCGFLPYAPGVYKDRPVLLFERELR